MAVEKMTYSKKAVHECYKEVKKLHSGVKVKADHFSKACEIKKVYEMCADQVNSWIFDYDYSDCRTYLNMAYDFKKYTCQELKQAQKNALRFLNNELEGIIYLMANGEVNVVA